MGGSLFIGEEPETLHRSPPGWIWIKPIADGVEIYELDEGGWILRATLSLTSHSHPAHGDINFIGTISADGEAGLTGSRIIDGHTLTFKNGILVGYEAP